MCAGQVFYIFCICYFGQNITDMNRKVNFAVFYIPSYRYSKKLNKSIKIIHSFTGKDLAIHGTFNFTANVETFGTVLNTAYSYMSLLFAWNN
ncbi:hypothetical protein O3M35_008495 [Rhynocoris fuscipes]|uniref:Uncharacterized protein n=1 Tax=Rhynocoris fuscipes TaxID=488301 RepID=A0AAW1D975_9HEMI